METEPVRYQLEEIQLSLDKERLEKVEHHHIKGKLGGTVEKECGCCLTNDLPVLLKVHLGSVQLERDGKSEGGDWREEDGIVR